MRTRIADTVHTVAPWTYGVRSRVSRTVSDRRLNPESVSGYPWGRIFDPLASLDMCTPLERAWIARYITAEHTGQGEIVELGSWLGGITLSLVQALPKNPAWLASRRPVHVYDSFRYDCQLERVAGSPLEREYVEGGSFQHHFERRLAPYADRLAVHPGNVVDARWTLGPIELLFNDVSKSWATWNAVRTEFYRSLRPGLTTVVEQDFAHSLTPWLHLWHYRARDHFRFIESVPRSGSVVFRLERKLEPELLEPDSIATYDEDEIDRAYLWAESLVDGYNRGNVAGAQVILQLVHGDPDRAVRLLVKLLEAADADTVANSELIPIVVPAVARMLDAGHDGGH